MIACISALALTTTAARAEAWRLVAATPEGAAFVDVDTIESSGNLRTFRLLAFKTKPDEVLAIDYGILRARIDCAGRTFQPLDTAAYAKDGTLLLAAPSTEPVEPITSGSAYVELQSAVCEDVYAVPPEATVSDSASAVWIFRESQGG
jgi:hypothetical protein